MSKKVKFRSTRSRLFQKLDIVVITCCLLGIILGGLGTFVGNLDYQEAEKEYTKLGKYVELTDTTTEINASIEDEKNFNIDWSSLRAINPEIVGWVVIPNTVINYPIVQTVDNQTYLHKSFEGNKNACGTIFMNSYNHKDFSDWNTIIYGHNMKNGSMFATLNKYKNEDFYKEHKEVWILTPSFERKYQIISAHEATDGTETYNIQFAENEYTSHISREVSNSNYDTGNGYNIDLPIVTLSTCTGRGTLSRFVLICQPVYEIKLNPYVQDEESTEESSN